MNIKEYEKESARTMSPVMHVNVLKPETVHGIIGIAGEGGELLDAIKRVLFYGFEPDIDNIREELGDLMWYIMAVVRSEGWELEDIMQENIDKLKVRFPEQFDAELAKLKLDHND